MKIKSKVKAGSLTANHNQSGMKSILLLGVFILGSAHLKASVLYSNFGAGTGGGDTVGSFTTGSYSIGTEFTASASGHLGQIQTAIADGAGSMTFDLYTNAIGQPGTLLEQWTNVTVYNHIFTSNIPLLTLTSALDPLLSSGNTYWFVATSAPTTGMEWDVNNENVLGGLWTGASSTSLTQNFPTVETPAIALYSTVPEPATWIFLAGGLALLGVRRAAVRL